MLTKFKAEHLPDHRSQASQNCSLPNAGPITAASFYADFQGPRSRTTVTVLFPDSTLDLRSSVQEFIIRHQLSNICSRSFNSTHCHLEI